MHRSTLICTVLPVGVAAISLCGCQPAAAPAAASVATVSPATQSVAPSARTAQDVVTRVYDDLMTGRDGMHRDDLYDPTDKLALEMLDGSSALRDGTKRLRVTSAKELEDCAAVIAIATEDGREDPFITYAVQKGGAWKLILPAGNIGPGRYHWTDEQMKRFEELRVWAHATAGVK
jgi:hypothetical protein